MISSTSSKSLTLEHALYGLVFLVALFLRLFRLGVAPLNDGEAYWALQALDLARGQLSISGAQPGYTVLTGLLFFLIDDTNALARLLPAMVGSLLVWLPLVMRPFLTDTPLLRRAGLLFALALAIDPALVSLSRQAGSLMTGLGLGLLALAFWLSGRPVWAGLMAGLAVLSGPGLLHGVLGLSIALVIAILSEKKGKHSPSFSKSTLLTAALTILVLGSGFGLYPRGLAGLASTLGAYLQSWLPGSSSAASTAASFAGQRLVALPLAILLYQPLAVLFGLIGGVRFWVSPEGEETSLGRFFGLWVASSFGATLLMPNRQVTDLAWTLLPLWGLAALELARYTLPAELHHQRWLFRGAAVLFGFFLVLGGYYLLYLHTMAVQPLLQAAMLAGIAAMAVIVAMLFAAGWSLAITRNGLVWGCTAVLALWMLSPTWGLSQLRPNGATEYWRSGPAAGQISDLASTVRDLSSWDDGIPGQLEIQSTVNSPSLRWALRDFSPVTYTTALAKDQLPAAFITPESTQSPELLASYRGQDFDWEIFPSWNGPLPPDLIQWLFLRKAPVASQRIILWIRADLFPGGELKP